MYLANFFLLCIFAFTLAKRSLFIFSQLFWGNFLSLPITFERLYTTYILCMSGGGLGSSTIFKNLMSPTPRRKWYLTTGRRAH